MPRRDDEIAIETIAGGCQLYSGVELISDMHGPATFSLTVGDDGSWQELSRIFAPSREVRLFCNGRLLFTGRFETNIVPTNPQSGSIAQLTARTKLSDARYATADLKVKVSGVSIRTFILALFGTLGYVAADFTFDAATDRDLVTGVRGASRAPVDLEPLTEDKAKIQPGEEIFTAATRHLKRHHLAIWDGADGKIVVGAPDDAQAPMFKLRTKRGAAAASNNIVAPRRIKDWSELASQVEVYGTTASEDDDPKPIRGLARDEEVLAAAAATGHFARRLILPLEGTKTQAKAEAQARRELASRAKEKDAWEHELDSWTFWDGQRSIPWTINTTVDVDVETIGSDGAGRYLIHRVSRTLDTDNAASCSLQLAAPGVLVF
jgi:hypothetical protein